MTNFLKRPYKKQDVLIASNISKKISHTEVPLIVKGIIRFAAIQEIEILQSLYIFLSWSILGHPPYIWCERDNLFSGLAQTWLVILFWVDWVFNVMGQRSRSLSQKSWWFRSLLIFFIPDHIVMINPINCFCAKNSLIRDIQRKFCFSRNSEVLPKFYAVPFGLFWYQWCACKTSKCTERLTNLEYTLLMRVSWVDYLCKTMNQIPRSQNGLRVYERWACVENFRIVCLFEIMLDAYGKLLYW